MLCVPLLNGEISRNVEDRWRSTRAFLFVKIGYIFMELLQIVHDNKLLPWLRTAGLIDDLSGGSSTKARHFRGLGVTTKPFAK